MALQHRERPSWARLPLLLLLVPLMAGIAAAQQKGAAPYKTMKLENGLEVIVIQNPTVPLVTIDVTVRNGAFTESDEYAGLSHLYEHMFFKANAAIPSQEQFMQRVRELGIVFNGYTAEDVVTYFFTLPSGNFEPGMKFMADAIKTPLFNEQELIRERQVVLGEFDRNEAQPTFVLDYALDSALWLPYVSRKQPLGQRQVIQTATVAKMKMIQNLFYVPNNSALIVSGDVDAEAVFALAKKYFNDWKRGSDPFPANLPPSFPPQKPMLVARAANIPDVDMQVIFRGPSVGKDGQGQYTAQLLRTLVNLPTSRFHHVMIDSGLVIDATMIANNARNVSVVGFLLNLSQEDAHHAMDVLKKEIAAMAEPGYFSQEDIKIAQRLIMTGQMFEQENPYSFAIGTTARWWSLASTDYYLGIPLATSRLNANDIQNFVKTYMYGQPIVLGVGAKEATLNQLNFTTEALQW